MSLEPSKSLRAVPKKTLYLLTAATMVEKNPVDFVRHGLTLQQFTQKN